MTRTILIACAVALAAAGSPALAKGPGGCPPGLAKKAVPCVPPGQAKKGVRYDPRTGEHYRLRVGDRYDPDRYRYDRLYDYEAYDLPPIGRNEGYYRDGYVVYRIDRETRRVLDLFRLAEIMTGQ
jgi:hypothetical protein